MTDTNESTQDTGTDSQEYVELHEADDADIEAFLANADSADSVPAPVEESDAVEPETTQEAELPKPAEDQQAQMLAKFEAMQRQLQGLELLNKRRTSEIAALKQQLAPILQVTKQQLDELHMESPSDAVRLQLAKAQAEAEFAKLSKEESQLQNQTQAQALLAQHAGPDGFDVETIAESLLEDGLPPEYVQQFVQNPYGAALPETLIQLAKRAKERKRVRELESVTSQLVYYLQRAMEDKSQAPNRVLANIQSAMQVGQSISARGGNAGTGRGVDTADISSLSDAELNELLGG